MLEKIRSIKRKTGISSNGRKLGKCLICGERVRTSHSHLTTAEGYAHKKCLNSTGILA